ncbi:autoinducer-binding transcriptional regulator BpsR [Noviherbaspirillum agri]
MDPWQQDCFDALLTIESEQELFKQAARIANSMGFDYCAYGIQMPVPVSRPNVALFNNYSDEWRQCYDARGYLAVDPTVRHALRSSLPLLWSDQLFADTPEFWDDARKHGLEVGWAQASRDASGTVGLLTLARGAETFTESELAANQARMSWLGQYVHAAMARLLTPRLAPESRVVLTAREKEVLRWTAEGKTAYEISQILNVAERTVNFHINNIVGKLGTANKTQAAVKAATLGLLF